MYRIAICDDNATEGQHTLALTQQILFAQNLLADFSLFLDPGDLLTHIRREGTHYDLLILDILFDKTNGIQLAKTLREEGEQGAIIYTTVSPDYAIDGYKVQASDYLLKPIRLNDLAKSIGRVIKGQDTMMVETDGVLRHISIPDIQYVESDGNYVVLRTADQAEVARFRSTLPEALRKLGSHRFARCHKGYLVNLGQVREVRSNHILLHSGLEVPLGRQYRAELQKEILRYVEKTIPH